MHDVVSVLAGALSASQLLELLQTGGEPMTYDELQQVLQALTGVDSPEEALPDYITAETFMNDLLGFAS